MRYRISQDAKMDLARIYWRGVEEFGEHQAEHYYNMLIQRFNRIAESPHQYTQLSIISKRDTDVAYVA